MASLLSIAVVSFNTRAVTLRCLEATREAAGDRPCLFTLVDNGSTDGTVEAVHRHHPEWRVIQLPDNPGYGAALNRAFAASPAPYVLALNSDVLLPHDALDPLLRFLVSRPECGIVAPALSFPDGRSQPAAKRFPTLGFALGEVLWLHRIFPGNRSVRAFYYTCRDFTQETWVDTISGAAMLIRGEAFQRIGGFDEGFRMYFEETDFCLRLQQAGFRVAICPEAKAVHWHGASTIQTSVRQVEYYLSYVRFFRNHHGRGPARILAVAVAASTLLQMLALPLKYPPLSGQRREILRGKLAACRRLLRQLWRPPTVRATREALP